MSEVLARCPFCKGDYKSEPHCDISVTKLSENEWVVSHYCPVDKDGNPTVTINAYGETREKAISRWNRCTQPENEALTLEELRKMDNERVWVQFDGIGMYGLVSYLTDEDYSADEEFEEVWITNSLGGRSSYLEIAEQGGSVFRHKPAEQEG